MVAAFGAPDVKRRETHLVFQFAFFFLGKVFQFAVYSTASVQSSLFAGSLPMQRM